MSFFLLLLIQHLLTNTILKNRRIDIIVRKKNYVFFKMHFYVTNNKSNRRLPHLHFWFNGDFFFILSFFQIQ